VAGAGHRDGEDTDVTDGDAQGRSRPGRTRRRLVAAAAVVALAGAVATEVLNAGTHEPAVDPGGTAERIGPGQSPSPSCPPPERSTSEAIAEARPGDREFEVVAVGSLCSVAEGDDE
jgi:hypothetical protein